MSVSTNKLRFFHVLSALFYKSNEDNLLNANDLIEHLSKQEINANRKTIYSDIETLREFGYDIESGSNGDKSGYYMASRNFELAELKLLVDSVQSSKFITAKKSEELIKKLEKLTCEHDASQLQRNVYVFNRPKTMNEAIYYTVDEIHNAMMNNKQIQFKYVNWTVDKELVPKHQGKLYKASPWGLTWSDDNYYLIAYDEEIDRIKHYRVDKIKQAKALDAERLGRELFDKFDMPAFAKKTFGMYGGKDERVKLSVAEHLVGVLFDRFGKDIMLVPSRNKDVEGRTCYETMLEISVSPQFFGWLAGIGTGIKVIAPESVKAAYAAHLKEILTQY